ncbi:MAG: type II secretion system F family protein [Candidatus Solibacter sp.]|nr:type II secretion system F family protein [Candidatus Solibacter sp.]
MLELLTATLFLLVAAGIAWAGLSPGTWRARGVRRLSPPPEHAAEMPSPGLLWRELVGRIGTAVPASARDLPRLKRRLMRAGFRGQNAAGYFQGARLVTTLLFAAGGLLGGSHTDNLLLIAAAAAAFGYIAPAQYVELRIRRRQKAIAHGLPNALDLMVVCVESGLGIDQTILQVAKELQTAHPDICDEFTVMNLELRAGKGRADALHNLADRTGVEDVKKLVAVLVQTDRFGTSIAQCLRGHAEYLRNMARQRAEEQAAKLAVKLVFPIFFCVLPTLFVVTIGPVMVRLVRDLVPMIENM